MATGATPGSGLPAASFMLARSPMTKTSRCPGMLRSGSTSTRPARSTGAPRARPERRGRYSSGPQHGGGGHYLLADENFARAYVRYRGVECAPRRRDVAIASRRSGADRRDRRSAPMGQLRPAEHGSSPVRYGGNPRASDLRAISAKVPASSTPVGPAPTTTKFSGR